MSLTPADEALLAAVTERLPGMAERDREFVTSVMHSVRRWQSMSGKQFAALRRALNPTPMATETVGEMSAVVALFERAKEKLKYPSIALQTTSGQKVEVSMAGARAKVPGSLNITDGGPYGNNIWFGRIRRDGVWEQPSGSPSAMRLLDEVRAIVRAFAANPEETASAYGKLTGCCCFCARTLTDDKSLAVGYGPTCAGNWNLPWGVKAAREAEPVLTPIRQRTRAPEWREPKRALSL